MRFLIFIAALSLLACGQDSSKVKKELQHDSTGKTYSDTVKTPTVVKDSPPTHITPDEEAVNQMLKARFENSWHVLNDKEAKWMKDAFDYFIVPKRKDIPNYPYIAKGDFNADGKEDMAAVVTDSLKSNYQIAIILAADNILFWNEDVLEDAAISTVAKSVIDGIDGEKTKKIKLKGDGINVEYFEKASFILYWDKTSFKRIQTGD